MKHRVVTLPAFWEALERALPSDHEPSWHQFAAYELNGILKTFGNGWDNLPRLYPERPDYRWHPGAGILGAWTVTAQWSTQHEEIQLVDITVDLWPPDMFDETSADE